MFQIKRQIVIIEMTFSVPNDNNLELNGIAYTSSL